MKKIMIILSITVLLASSCGQATKKQAEIEGKKETYFVELSATHGLSFMRYDNELELWYEPHIIDFRNNDTLGIDIQSDIGFNSLVRVSPNGKYVMMMMDNIVLPYENDTRFHALVDIENAQVITMFGNCFGEWDNNSNWVNNGRIEFLAHFNKSLLFDIQQIDSITYFALKKNANIQVQKVELEKITNLEQAKEMLKEQVKWGKIDEETYELVKDERGDRVCEIMFRNGKTISYDYPDMEFVAYFPQEDVLFIAGEHSFPVICNLTTGEETDDVGDPEYRYYSPSKQYRFNGYYNGQAEVYFIQKKSGAQYKTIIQTQELFEKYIGTYHPEWLLDVFWQNDTILNFIEPRYFYPVGKSKKFYYQFILK